MVKYTENSTTITENQQCYPKNTKQTVLSYCCIPDIVFQAVCKKRKQDGEKYYLHIHWEECIYTEKKPERNNIKRNLIVPEQ